MQCASCHVVMYQDMYKILGVIKIL